MVDEKRPATVQAGAEQLSAADVLSLAAASCNAEVQNILGARAVDVLNDDTARLADNDTQLSDILG